MSGFHSFLRLNNTIVCICHILLTYLLSWVAFIFLAIVNNANDSPFHQSKSQSPFDDFQCPVGFACHYPTPTSYLSELISCDSSLLLFSLLLNPPPFCILSGIATFLSWCLWISFLGHRVGAGTIFLQINSDITHSFKVLPSHLAWPP